MTTRTKSMLADRIRSVLALDPRANAIEYDGEWWTWGRIAELARATADRVPGPGSPCGILLRNTPEHVAMLLGVLLADGCVVTVNPSLGAERVRADLGSLELDLLLGTPADLATFGEAPVAGSATARPGVAVLMLTSGTTGTPKRIELGADVLVRTTATPGPPRLRPGIAVVNSPLVHLSGVFRVLQCVLDGRPFVLLPRFEVEAWADAVRRHRPKTASLVPTALRMVLESGLTRDDLDCLVTVTSGTAPLDPADAEAFEERFGVPVLTSYAATEFGGGVAGWTLADHREHGRTKRGSVGRVNPGCGIRIVDESGAERSHDQVGLLEVRPAQLGDDAPWLRTTDLGRVDEDGFLWIVGRADQTIIRGGFKVQPDTVRAALEKLPAVRTATVLGVPDDRLGELPVALVELREGADATAAGLLGEVAPYLARYEVPADLRIVTTLPRTASGKVDLTAARAVLERTES